MVGLSLFLNSEVGIVTKLLCLIGWHRWSWSVAELGWGDGVQPPKDAKCFYCGVEYGHPREIISG
jgi:hypothetical protein